MHVRKHHSILYYGISTVTFLLSLKITIFQIQWSVLQRVHELYTRGYTADVVQCSSLPQQNLIWMNKLETRSKKFILTLCKTIRICIFNQFSRVFIIFMWGSNFFLYSIPQADGDNQITARGCTIVKQTTGNQHK